jgi:hypothetical protein
MLTALNPLFKPKSGKVHVVAQAILAGALQEGEEMGAFRMARSAADQNDQSGLSLRSSGERQEVITVAADQDQALRTRILKNFFIGCGNRQYCG